MLEIGTSAEAAYVADDDDMASSFCLTEQDTFPEVFSTARMLALMETAGGRVLKPLLQPGQVSVGVTVNIKHFAATPNHTQVSARATFLGTEGKLYKFKVEAFDVGGKIGEGEHSRAIVNTERLLQGASARLQATAAKSDTAEVDAKDR
jgi:predicted thioesterase